MEKYLSELENVRPVAISKKRKNFKCLYTVLCGIECEYALFVLGKNAQDPIFKHIASYFFTPDTSAKRLFKEFSYDQEMEELHNLLKFNEDDEESIESLLKTIRWVSTGASNTFCIGGFFFSSDKLFIDIKEYDGKYYFLNRKSKKGEDDQFEAIGLSEVPDLLKYQASNNICQFMGIKEIGYENYKRDDVDRDIGEVFFNITRNFKEANDAQRSAISASTNKNALIIGGAGTGKTRTLVGRLVYLHLVQDIPLKKILLLTFSRTANEEFKITASQQIKDIYISCGIASLKNPSLAVYTYDGFFKLLVEKYYADIGMTESPSFWFGDAHKSEKLRMLNYVIAQNEYSLDNFLGNYKIEEIYKNLEKCAQGIPVNISGLESLLELYVQQQIRENIIVDFVYCGLILKNVLKNKQNPLHTHFLEMYDCVLIDEFQDISLLQNAVLSNFYNSSVHFTFTGDDDQSIYSWRGADNNIIKKMVRDAGVNTIYLTSNYRNNPYIVEAGNDILSTLEDRTKAEKNVYPVKKIGGKVRLVRYDKDCENLVQEIIRRYDISQRSNAKIAILYRSNPKNSEGQNEVSIIEQKLREAGIPMPPARNDSFIPTRGYQFLKALINILNGVDVDNNCEYIKYEFKVSSFSNEMIFHLVQGTKSANEVICGEDETLEYAVKIADLATSVNPMYSDFKTVFDIVCNYSKIYAEIVEGSADGTARDKTLLSFQDFVSDIDPNYPINKDFVLEIFNYFEDENKQNSSEKFQEDDTVYPVTISTIHKAQGLQYDTVFVIGLNEGEYPKNTEYVEFIPTREIRNLMDSQKILEIMRTEIPSARIEELKQNCKRLAQNAKENDFSDDMLSFCDEIEAFRDELSKLSDEGVTAYIEAYYDYFNKHIQGWKEVYNQQLETQTQHNSDLKERNSYYKRWDASNDESVIKAFSNLKLSGDDIENNESIDNIRSFYKWCLAVKSCLEDNCKLCNLDKTKQDLSKKSQKVEMEERRLFYVAVSRASEMLYLCTREGTNVSPYVQLIHPENCEYYEIGEHVQAGMESLEEDVNLGREISISDKSNDELQKYVQERIDKYKNEHTICNTFSPDTQKYLNQVIEFIVLSERVGHNLLTELLQNLLFFVHQFMRDKIGEKAKTYKTSLHDANKIIADIKKIADVKCKIDAPPGVRYLKDLLTKDMKYKNELEQCKSLAIHCYIVCSGKYKMPELIIDTWELKKFVRPNPELFLVAALDLINMRNLLIHDNKEKTNEVDLPYAFDCVNIIIKYFVQTEENLF